MLGGVPVTTAWHVHGLRMEEQPAENMLTKQRGQTTRGGPLAWGLRMGLTTLHCKK
jgi:hypothetical protein